MFLVPCRRRAARATAWRLEGRVWAHELSADDIAAYFPAGQFMGGWGTPVGVEPSDVRRCRRRRRRRVWLFCAPRFPPAETRRIVARARFAPTVDGSRCRRRASLGGDARCLALHAGATPRRGVSWLAVARAQMLAMPFPSGGEVYVIRKSLFAKTYRALSARTSGRASLLATSGSFVRAVRAARD